MKRSRFERRADRRERLEGLAWLAQQPQAVHSRYVQLRARHGVLEALRQVRQEHR